MLSEYGFFVNCIILLHVNMMTQPLQQTTMLHDGGRGGTYTRDVIPTNMNLVYESAAEAQVAAEQFGSRDIGDITPKGPRSQNTIPAFWNIPPFTPSTWMYHGGMVGAGSTRALYVNPISDVRVTDTIEYMPNAQQMDVLESIKKSNDMEQAHVSSVWASAYGEGPQLDEYGVQQNNNQQVTLETITMNLADEQQQARDVDSLVDRDVSAMHYRFITNSHASEPDTITYNTEMSPPPGYIQLM